MKYNILVLHNLSDLQSSLRSMVDYLKCFERYGPDHNFIYYKWTDPVTPSLRKMDFHVVILDASALGVCRYRPRELYYELKENWDFVAELDAVKIAFPQDDYHQSNVLDELFDDWNVDIVYSVLPKHMAMFYPRTGLRAQLKGVLTGYVDDNSIDVIPSISKSFGNRQFDVGQRVSMYSPLGGRYAQIKGLLAEKFKDLATAEGFSCNISHAGADSIRGDNWMRFLGDCRFVLGGEGGVSVWDPDGLIFDKVMKIISEHPTASFEEIEEECFPGEDGRFVFTAVSPRLFEAAMVGSCQILTEGEYLNLLKPFEHYIPVKQDLSDLESAVKEMGNWEGAQKMISATYESLVNNPLLRYSGLVSEVMKDVDAIAEKRNFTSTDDISFENLFENMRSELEKQKHSNTEKYVYRVAGMVPKSVREMIPGKFLEFIKAKF